MATWRTSICAESAPILVPDWAVAVTTELSEVDGCDLSVPPATSCCSALAKESMPLLSVASELILAVFASVLAWSWLSLSAYAAETRLVTSVVVSMPEPAPSAVRIVLPALAVADCVVAVDDVEEEVVVIASVPSQVTAERGSN